LFTVVKVGVSVALIALLLTHAGISHLTSTLGHANRWWLLLGLVLGVIAAMLQANQWRGLLNAFGVHRPYGRCLRLDTAARLFDAALPTNIGGDVIRVRLASGNRGEMAPAALAVALRRVMSLPGLLLLIAIGLVGSWPLSYAGRARAISVACLVGGAVLGLLLFGAQRLGGIERIRLPRPVEKLRTSLRDARNRSVGSDRHPFARATLRGLLFWIVVVASQACYIEAVGIHSPIEYSIAVVTCVNALSMLPISLGGYGLREGAFSALLGVSGLGTVTQGTAVGVCLSAQTLLFGLIGGLFYLTLGRASKPARHRRAVIPLAPPVARRDLTFDHS
jgi:uncharacterized protein (TIRG00374 family)